MSFLPDDVVEDIRAKRNRFRRIDREQTVASRRTPPPRQPSGGGRFSILGDIAGAVSSIGNPFRFLVPPSARSGGLDIGNLTNPSLPGGGRLFEPEGDFNPVTATGRFALRAAEDLDRFGGAVRAPIIEGELSPSTVLAGARRPSAFPGTALPGVRGIENPILRGAAGLGAEALLDPLDIAFGAPLAVDIARPASRLVRQGASAVNALADPAALRRAAPEAFQSGRGQFQDVIPRQTIAGGAPRAPIDRMAGRSVVAPEQVLREQSDELAAIVADAPTDPEYLSRLTPRAQTLVDDWFRGSPAVGSAGTALRDQVRAGAPGFQELYDAGDSLRARLRAISGDGETVVLYRGDRRLQNGLDTAIDADVVQSYTTSPRTAERFTGAVFGGPSPIERRVVKIDDVVAPGAGFETELMVLQPGRANAVPDFPFGGLAGGADVPEFNRAKEELLRYLDEDDAIVRSGTRSAEKREGTAARGASIRGAIDNPPPGATPEEIASGILSSRRTGDIIRTTPAPAALDPATRGAYIEEVLNQHAAGRITDFQAGTAIDALNLARTGRLTEDAQKTLMRSILGEGLPPSAVGVTPAAGPRRRPRAGGLPGAPPRTPATTGPTLVGRTRRGVNRPLKPPRIGPPTPPRPPVLNVGAELAAAARKFKAAQLPRRTAAPVPGRSSLASVNQAELSELNMARKLIPEPLKPPRRGTGAASGAKPDILGPDIGIGLVGDENVLRTIKRMPNVPDDVQEAIRIWLEANRVRLDAIGPEWNQTFTNIRASLSGNVADSFVTALLHRKSNLQQALRRTGIVENDELVKSLVDDLFEMELRKRFGFDVPPRVRNMLAEARSTEGLADLGSFELAAQRVKNTIFGFADIGVFGVQVQASLVRNGVAGIVGMVNRILAASHIHDFRPLYTSTVGNRQVQYAVDGLGQGVGPSAVRSELGTILQYLGPVGRTIDRPVTAISAWLNQMQFGNILQWVRDSTHEGNLMILHLTGNDIADPAVRRASAESANMASSWAHQALRRSRGAAETTVLTSPMMTRAQFAHVRQLMNALNPASGANRAERTLAAVSIASTAIYSLVIGKGIHDLVGKGDFTFDPREPGFGFLTLANGTVINMFPQTSFVDAIARSFGALVEQDAKGVWEAWARFGLGRTSFLSSNVLSAAGVGFEPGSGFRFGDLSPDARLLNLAPLPPIIQQAVTEGVDLDQLILEGIGVSAFDESSFGMERRTFNDEHSGLDFDDASRADRRDHLAAHPEIEELRMEERQTLARRGDRLSQALLIANNDDPSVPGVNGLGTRQRLANLEQLSIDERTGVVDHGGYRSARRTILSEQRGKSSAYDDVLDDFAESDDEAERDAARLYELYDEAKDIAELPDFDLFAELEANLQQELGLERWTSAQVIVNGIDPRDNPLEQEYQQALNAVAASGLFRVSDDAWADMQGLTPLLREFPSFFEYRDQVVNDFIQLSMLSNPAFSDGEHRDEANRRFNNSRVVKQYRDVRSAHRAAWRATAPPEAVDFAETWELIDTTLESRAGTITKQRLLDLDRQLTAAP